MPQSTIFISQNIFRQQNSQNRFLHWKLYGWSQPKNMHSTDFPSKSNLNCVKIADLFSSINVCVNVSVTVKGCSTVRFFVWFLGTQSGYWDGHKEYIVVGNVLSDILDAFRDNLHNFCYHGISCQSCICTTLFTKNVPGKIMVWQFF